MPSPAQLLCVTPESEEAEALCGNDEQPIHQARRKVMKHAMRDQQVIVRSSRIHEEGDVESLAMNQSQMRSIKHNA